MGWPSGPFCSIPPEPLALGFVLVCEGFCGLSGVSTSRVSDPRASREAPLHSACRAAPGGGGGPLCLGFPCEEPGPIRALPALWGRGRRVLSPRGKGVLALPGGGVGAPGRSASAAGTLVCAGSSQGSPCEGPPPFSPPPPYNPEVNSRRLSFIRLLVIVSER